MAWPMGRAIRPTVDNSRSISRVMPRRTAHAAGVKVREMARATAFDTGANRAERSSTFVRPLDHRPHRWAIFSGK